MPKPTYILLAFLASLLSNLPTAQPPTTPTYFNVSCRRTLFGNYTISSVYSINLSTVLSELKQQAPSTSSNNTSAGSDSDTVYGQYYCRGDIDSTLCSACIQAAAQTVLLKCPNARAAVVFYHECTLLYANQSTVGVYAEFPHGNVWSTASVLDPDTFGAVLQDTLGVVFNKSVSTPLHFATREGVVSRFVTVYVLAQCRADLSGSECGTCLRAGYSLMSKCCGKWPLYQTVYFPSCQMRYSTQGAFYWPVLNGPPPVSAPAPVASPRTEGKDASCYVLRAVVPAAVGLLVTLAVSFCLVKRTKWKKLKKLTTEDENIEAGRAAETVETTTDCLQFDLKTINAATNSFSVANKLGQGGFGIVYKGILKDGQNIAVKRLSENSGQGTEEFKTEVAVLAQLQHQNLVRLVGCCVDGVERLLVYEFLCNSSLDNFLFDEKRSAYLTWAIRHKIIQGIARGLHYLHEDSRARIVHRDLKTSNILLDDNLDPKIADFGMARLVKVDQTATNYTMRVVGTYGYMAPEYAMGGRYSPKSDVYSFGIIILEILCGKSNNKFSEASHGEALLHYSWRIWNEGSIEELIDPIVQNNYSTIEAERCLQLGLLCTQDDEVNRPPMHAMLLMLNSNTVDLPPPFPPSHSNYIKKFSASDDTQEGSSSKHQVDESSGSSVSLLSSQTDLYAR